MSRVDKARPDPTIAIIGGGFGGIAAGVKLKKAGIETFTIFEKSEWPGRDLVGQPLPGGRGGCQLSPLLLLVPVQ